ncbi:hypothetical protein POTOM_006960 [Populus tomentosa]|uniref:Pentatricopeptide repeat-containing protein n=1 Tax=Populus tomentosa TaxID=118781 RepID=A0A8X8AK69_POPTO|nr:hypothetical protein POTOM_006960 [Populus tomentosa]
MNGGIVRNRSQADKITDKRYVRKNGLSRRSDQAFLERGYGEDFEVERAAFKSFEQSNDVIGKTKVLMWKIEEKIQKLGNCHVYTTALHVLGKAKRPVEALNLFHAMQEEKVVSGISLGSVLMYKIVALSFPWGYGFTAPSDGSKNVFLKSDGCLHLQPNTSIEDEILRGSEGKTQTINFTAPGGRLLQNSRKLGPGESITGSSSSRSMSFLSSNTSGFNNVGP